MKISNFNLEEKVLVIAEIGNNHEGNFEVAKQLIYKAAECGVDAVKFQTYKTKNYVRKNNIERYKKLESFELSYEQFYSLSKIAKSLGLLFVSTPLDLESAKFLEDKVDVYKIASGDNDFYSLIRQVIKTNKPVMISTGLSDSEQIEKLVNFVENLSTNSINQVALLHCVSSYPVPFDETNLNSIRYLKEKFGLSVGYSDHTLGINAAVLSIALGARIIEKHFTLDKNYSDYRDHKLSAEPAEMKELVEKVKLALLMLGSKEKKVKSCETPLIKQARRSIVASKELSKGIILTENDLTWMRPGGGLPPGEEYRLLNKELTRDVCHGEQLDETYFK